MAVWFKCQKLDFLVWKFELKRTKKWKSKFVVLNSVSYRMFILWIPSGNLFIPVLGTKRQMVRQNEQS